MAKNTQFDERNSTIVDISQERYLNLRTGEEETFNRITKKVVGYQNFWKIIMIDFLAVLGLFDSKQVDVFIYLLQNLNPGNNLFIGSLEKIAKGTGVSKRTVVTTFKKLQANNFVKMVQRGVWAVNPEIVMKGNENKKNILLSYYEEKTPRNKDLPKVAKAKKSTKKQYTKEDEIPLDFDK